MTTIKIALKEEIKKQIYIYIYLQGIFTHTYNMCTISVI